MVLHCYPEQFLRTEILSMYCFIVLSHHQVVTEPVFNLWRQTNHLIMGFGQIFNDFLLSVLHIPISLDCCSPICARYKRTPLPSGSPMHVVCSQQSRISEVLENPSSTAFPEWFSGNMPSNSRKHIQKEYCNALLQTGKHFNCVSHC